MTDSIADGVSSRAPAWGADTPAGEAEARERLLDAAEACYARGPRRTSMSNIASMAGVHRTTVYTYFPNKDAMLAACFVRATAGVLKAADPEFDSEGPFLEKLVRAWIAGMNAARSSSIIRLLVDDEEVAGTYRAAEASELWREAVTSQLEGRMVEAMRAGEVRDDLPVETLARWVIRCVFSFIAEPGHIDDGGDEGLMRAFVIPSLEPRRPPGR